MTLSWEGIGGASSYSVKRATSETGAYQTIASGVTDVSCTDLTAQNGTTYYYVVSVIIAGQESPNSGARAATSVGAPGIVSWNYDRYGTVSGNNIAGVVAATNWNNSWPNDPVTNLADNHGAPTTMSIAYNYYATASMQKSLDLQTWFSADPQPVTNSVDLAVTTDRQFFRLTRP